LHAVLSYHREDSPGNDMLDQWPSAPWAEEILRHPSGSQEEIDGGARKNGDAPVAAGSPSTEAPNAG